MANKTLHDLIFESLKGKYFQNKGNPDILIESVNSFGPSVRWSDTTFLGYSPTLEKQKTIPMFLLKDYIEISKEEFDRLVFNYNNKANLSEKASSASELDEERGYEKFREGYIK